ncbi:DegT/DnrJ/EryC1/StrS aminotransferase [Janibacter hoylei PVAS-1]|uniref:DegT/DnrJ/EryC1/StrS aminotransferase n=1 Tax=Janibacter hoylei PVAS-1 TaxID=1210046 RepID=K1E2Y2_9MICO|nr:DegT/DnrJ/EryC1/StrS family aminotransferase [Janibacter hoylei]EKA61346.1 DegT/DnrJ/EryC1/StrS aminotransferase [Janibacter hoylei PVAS-1]RWU84465.1 DegT/DnrJ/EryC1/StrS family aminotransferase [Janibacter hoylei PVAS-1]
MSERILMSQALIGAAEERYVLDALRSGWVAPLGPHVDAFEREIAERVGVGHALALSSGTAALHLALIHLGARPGTKVVLSSMTFAATANAVVYTGAEPVFVDSQSSDGNVDAELMLDAVRALQAEGETVVAAIPVDLFGRPCDYGVLEQSLADLGVPLLEDAAESLGASLDARAAGSFGRAAALSFNGNKIMTTSGGGMLLSDDAELIDHARKLSTQSREPVAWYEHTEIGYNYRLSNVLAALGRGQLERLDQMIARRREIRDRYATAFADLPLRFLGRDDAGRDDAGDNYWLTTVVLDFPFPEVRRRGLEGTGDETPADKIVSAMSDQHIEVRHLWKPMHLQPVFSDARSFTTGVSEDLFTRGVTLPSGPALSDSDIDHVADSLHRNLAQ